MRSKRVLRLRRETLASLVEEELWAVAAGAAAATEAPYTICYLYQCPGTFASGCQIGTVRTTPCAGEG